MPRQIALGVSLFLLVAMPVSADRPRKPYADDAAVIEQQLAELGIAADSPAVVAAASHENETVRLFAVKLLGYRGGRGSEIVLRERLLGDPSRTIRAEAALALIRLGHFDAVDDALKLVEDADDPTRRLYLAGQLARLGELGAYPHVVEAATSQDPHRRFLSAGVLVSFLLAGCEGTTERPDPEGLLLALLGDESAKVRSEALLAVAVGAPQGLDVEPYLQQIRHLTQQDPDAEIREQARLWLAGREPLADGAQ